MKSSLWPHVLSIFALGLFCILAAGSMEDNSSRSTPQSTPQRKKTDAELHKDAVEYCSTMRQDGQTEDNCEMTYEVRKTQEQDGTQ
jgi:hypothetical protein